MKGSVQDGTDGGSKCKNSLKNLPTVTTYAVENPNSCIIKIGKQKFRPLLDTGAAVSLVNSDVYWSLPYHSKLLKPKVNLKSVNGADLKIEGCTNIEFKIGGLTLSHEFYVVKNVNRSFILGRDRLVKNGVRLYFDIGSLRIGKTYVPMVEDIHIASILRACKKTILRPQTSTFCYARHKNHANFENKTVEVSAIDKYFINDEPGLMIGSSVLRTKKSRKVLYFWSITPTKPLRSSEDV